MMTECAGQGGGGGHAEGHAARTHSLGREVGQGFVQ